MDRITLLIFAVLAAGFSPGVASAAGKSAAAAEATPDRWQGFIAEASRRFRLPEAWIYAVMIAESGGRTMLDGRPITSRSGAMGLMQLMPDTWEEMRRAHGLGADPHDPRNNILAGAAYLRDMYHRFGYPGLFAAYNAGPKRYADYLARGRPLPPDTVAYVASITRIHPDALSPIASGTQIFVKLRTATNSSSEPILPVPSNTLFVPLTTAPAGYQEPGMEHAN
jgi:soluble lytic murein transglycosylase-like protein